MRQRGSGVLRLALRLASQRLEFVRRQGCYIRVAALYDPPEQSDCNFDGRGRGGEEPGEAERRWRRVLRMARRGRGGERAACIKHFAGLLEYLTEEEHPERTEGAVSRLAGDGKRRDRAVKVAAA